VYFRNRLRCQKWTLLTDKRQQTHLHDDRNILDSKEMVEAVGIEPTSSARLPGMTTCVACA
jgi:hypothetical protein